MKLVFEYGKQKFTAELSDNEKNARLAINLAWDLVNENTSSPEPAGEPRERRPSKSIKNPKGAGRPRIINRVTTKTSQDGLRDGLTRATFIVPEKTLAEIKEIVFKDEERRPLKYHIAEALSDYVEKIKNKEVKYEKRI